MYLNNLFYELPQQAQLVLPPIRSGCARLDRLCDLGRPSI